MKLNGDSLKIESRSEIDDLQAILQTYLKNGGELASVTNDELTKIIVQLDVLYMNW